MGISNDLVKGIQQMIKGAVNSAPFNKTKKGRIKSVNSDGTYDIIINGAEYKKIKPTSIKEVGVNDIVSVNVPENQMTNMTVNVPNIIIDRDILLSDNITVSASSYKTISGSVTNKIGYIPIGILEIKITNATDSGTGSKTVCVNSFYIGTQATVVVKNPTTTDAKIKVTVSVIYIKE